MKKLLKISSILLIFGFMFLSIGNFNIKAVENNTSSTTNLRTPKSTATYYYWKQTGSSLKETNYTSDWITYDTFTAYNTGQTYTINFQQQQSGTISIGISVGGKLFGGSLSYTPGTNATVTASSTSPSLNAGQKCTAQYRKKEFVYYIYQEKWLYDLGTDTYVSSTTGTQSFPANPDVRFIIN